MTEKDRIGALKNKHVELESEIKKEFGKSTPDDLLIAALKREKLRIKDELAGLEPAH